MAPHSTRTQGMSERRPSIIRVVVSAAAVTGFAVAAIAILPRGVMGDAGGVGGGDAHAYWVAGRNVLLGANLYTGVSGGADAYLYPPPFAQVISPLAGLLSASAFVWLWRLISIAALLVAAGGWRAAGIALLVFPPAIVELDTANVHFVLALVCALVMRGTSPALPFAFVLKLAGGGAFPFAAHWNLRGLIIGSIAAGAVVAMSIALSPHSWTQYAAFLGGAQPTEYWTNLAQAVPLLPRLVFSALVGLLAIRWPILLPFAFVLSMPIVSLNSLAILVCVAPEVQRWFARAVTRTRRFGAPTPTPASEGSEAAA